MPFNLKGGRPKSMKQGTYWVKRHVADQKREAAAHRRTETAKAKLVIFNERHSRIIKNCANYHIRHQGEQMIGTPKQVSKLRKTIQQYAVFNNYIDSNIENEKLSDIAKLATLGRSIITACAKFREQEINYDATKKVITVAGITMDFG